MFGNEAEPGAAYGIFNTLYGVVWFLGSTAAGYLYDVDMAYVFGFIVFALVCFLIFRNGVLRRELISRG